MHSSFFLLRLQDCKAASGCTGLQPYIVVHHYKLKAALIIQDSFFVSYSVFIFSAKDIALLEQSFLFGALRRENKPPVQPGER